MNKQLVGYALGLGLLGYFVGGGRTKASKRKAAFKFGALGAIAVAAAPRLGIQLPRLPIAG